MSEQMREHFEHYYGLPFDECDAFTQNSWKAAWMASRETLVIDLPKTINPGGPDDNIYWPADVVAAIEVAGVRVKP